MYKFMNPELSITGKPEQGQQIEIRLLRALRRIIRAVDIHSRKLSVHYKITTPQLLTLLCIIEDGPVAPSEIARRVQLSSSTIVGILDRLEAKGLVRRQRSTKDRRLVYLEATETGVHVGRSAPSPLQDALVEKLAKLSRADQLQIVQSVERIVDMMEAQQIDAAPILDVGLVNPSVDQSS
ncbi:MAG: MarR family transcriptional regulator [Candidatus Hydrogenedentes bacterium]|nr:MarR family transcriptional regulator [Candidatus Hydrogenedentota bacterium]